MNKDEIGRFGIVLVLGIGMLAGSAARVATERGDWKIALLWLFLAISIVLWATWNRK